MQFEIKTTEIDLWISFRKFWLKNNLLYGIYIQQMHLIHKLYLTLACANIYASDQAKSFKSREFTRELTQPSKHFFLFK